MGKIIKFVWEWISEYPIVVFVMLLVTVGDFIIKQISDNYNEGFTSVISNSFFPNVVFITFFCMIGAEAFHTYRKWKRYPRKAAVKPYITKFEAGSKSFVKWGFFMMDWVSIAIFIISFYPIGFGNETDSYKKAMFFHGFFALAIVPFITSIFFTIKKEQR
ncbi:membrane hypothetical protein [Candidatus Nitrosotenuis uzonensis]|uniref:Uncharacterized protein n=1 Tax=Candidatus Nitrosotenuis uzonensis TaxID=1407055 RepID=V6AV29_9ARCH|nr:membrane hypothetical protein [Candidatus Nitrosotenuis uzonensis]